MSTDRRTTLCARPRGRQPARAVESVGIDVAEPRKGLDLVALDGDRNVVVSRGRLCVAEAAAITLALRPSVTCIDSPPGWSTSGRSRAGERELGRIGIQSYRTGPDPGDHPFYRWMRVGFELFERLAAAYPLYRRGAVAGTAAEVFPHASACLLAGALRPRDMAQSQFRRQVLRAAGIPAELPRPNPAEAAMPAELPTPDRVDAALAALTGLIALDGGHCAAGDPDEGVILLPVPRLPSAPLQSATRAAPAHTRR